jgi:O-antigen ligase
MTERDLYGLLYFGGIGLLLCAVAVIAFGSLLQAERRIGRWMPVALVPLIVLGIAISSLLSGRVLTYVYESIESINAAGRPGGTDALRVLTLAILGCSLAVITGRLFAQQAQTSRTQQPLFLAFVALFITHTVLNAALGTKPDFVHNSFYFIFPFLAVYMTREQPARPYFHAAKIALAVFMLASLVAAVLLRDLAVQTNYPSGWVPGLTLRLWGLASNPNSLGPLAVLVLLLEWSQPSRTRLGTWAVALPALAVLFLSQSKTAWGAAVVLLVVLSWYRLGKAPGGGIRIGYLLAVLAMLLAVAVASWIVGPERIMRPLDSGQVSADLTTFSGRVQIWVAAIRTWADNPLFGYGPNAWGPEHRVSIGMPYAFSAHNQFLDSLSGAGLMGLGSLVIYLVLLGIASRRAVGATRGASMALFLLILARCVTETPMDLTVLLSGELVANLILFRMVLNPLQPHADRTAVVETSFALAR